MNEAHTHSGDLQHGMSLSISDRRKLIGRDKVSQRLLRYVSIVTMIYFGYVGMGPSDHCRLWYLRPTNQHVRPIMETHSSVS